MSHFVSRGSVGICNDDSPPHAFFSFFRQKKLIFPFRMKCKWIFIHVVSVFEEEKEKKLRPKRYVTFCRVRSFVRSVAESFKSATAYYPRHVKR